jgi:hypothetical protein
MPATQTSTGLPQSEERRWHFDIYAMLEGAQELYFGHETQVNVNLVEMVTIDGQDKCYISPTKRRGVERRTLIWAPLKDGRLLGDKLGCGIPHTCTQDDCPICRVYGGLITSDTEVGNDVPGGPKRKPNTFIGRLTHGGGVAVQSSPPEEKQRAMHSSMLNKEPSEKPTPTPFKREYNEPALLYPVYNHLLSVSEDEFGAAAYAFDNALARLGAGNPKGVRIYEAQLLESEQPLLVLDRYLVPLGKRPVISPAITDKGEAIGQFTAAALTYQGKTVTGDKVDEKDKHFTRWIGNAALQQLQDYALQFADTYLAK